jgi:hypothetical protein
MIGGRHVNNPHNSVSDFVMDEVQICFVCLCYTRFIER